MGDMKPVTVWISDDGRAIVRPDGSDATLPDGAWVKYKCLPRADYDALAAERAAHRETTSDRDLLDGMLKAATGGIADLRAVIIEHLNMEGLASDLDRRMAALVGWPEGARDV